MKEQKEIVGSISLEEIWVKEAREALNKLLFFSEPIKRNCSVDVQKQDELSRQRWIEKVISSLNRLSELEKVLMIIQKEYGIAFGYKDYKEYLDYSYDEPMSEEEFKLVKEYLK